MMRRGILACGAGGLALLVAGGLAAYFPADIEAIASSLDASPAIEAPHPALLASIAPSNPWLAQFPSSTPLVPVAEVLAEPRRALALKRLSLDIDLRVDRVAGPDDVRFIAASSLADVGQDLFSRSSGVRLQFAKNGEGVETADNALPEDGVMAAMGLEAITLIAMPEPEVFSQSVAIAEGSDFPAAAAGEDEFDPFAGFGLVSDPVSSLVSAYAGEQKVFENLNVEVEDAEYVAPFAKAEVDPAAGLVTSSGEINLEVLASMSPEQMRASIALLAALKNPDQAQSFLDRLDGAHVEPSVRQLPAPIMSGIPGLNDDLVLPSASGAVLAPVEAGNLLTRGWRAIDNFGVVTLRRDGDASTDLVVEEGMVLGALGPVVSVRRTNTLLIVETANAGEITGSPDFRPRPRPEWMGVPN